MEEEKEKSPEEKLKDEFMFCWYFDDTWVHVFCWHPQSGVKTDWMSKPREDSTRLIARSLESELVVKVNSYNDYELPKPLTWLFGN